MRVDNEREEGYYAREQDTGETLLGHRVYTGAMPGQFAVSKQVEGAGGSWSFQAVRFRLTNRLVLLRLLVRHMKTKAALLFNPVA